MDRHPTPPPEELLKQIQPKTNWFFAYKGLSFSIVLLVLAVMSLVVINISHGTNTKISEKNLPAKNSNPVSVWNSNYGNLLVNLNNDINNINAQVANQSYTGQETACQQLSTDVATASAAPIIPNTSAESQLTSGLAYLQQAAESCINGTQIYLNQADNSKPIIELQAVNDLKTFATDLQLGTTQIQNLASSIQTLSR